MLDTCAPASSRCSTRGRARTWEPALEVVRLIHHEPALRAAYQMLRGPDEDALTEVLAQRTDLPAYSIDVRMQAAVTSAVLKAPAEDVAAGRITVAALGEQLVVRPHHTTMR